MKKAIVETVHGKVRGETNNGIYSFKGIPYGGSTGGKNRFMSPTSPDKWPGVRDATRYGPASWQVLENFDRRNYELFGTLGIHSISEDCLVLNVWTSGTNDQGKRPVMVWLHGGGFFAMSADHFPCFDGASLAKTQNVVLVSVNHRLGVFGYLHLEEIAGEKYAGSGNAGMLDLVAALEWIRDNISNFGGDPDNVTIFGESGGGAKVSILMAMPSAKGLFHHAIVESGFSIRAQTVDSATRTAHEFLDLLGVSPGNIDLLHKMQPDMIHAAWMSLPPIALWLPPPTVPGQFYPVVDGKALPAHPFEPVASEISSDVPLLIGSNKDEMTFMLFRDPRFGKFSEANIREGIYYSLRFHFFDITEKQIDDLIENYRLTRPKATTHDLLIAITSDTIRNGMIRIAERKAADGRAPAYMYRLDWESPAMNGVLKSCHTLELPLVFNNVDPVIGVLGETPERFLLAGYMSAAWASFARSGNPNHSGIPLWPTYSTDKRSTMSFNIECRIINDPCSEERMAWDGIF